MEASAAAAQAARPLSDARWSLTVEKETPHERDIEAEALRIGVFVCHCGHNIARKVRVAEVVEAVGTVSNYWCRARGPCRAAAPAPMHSWDNNSLQGNAAPVCCGGSSCAGMHTGIFS